MGSCLVVLCHPSVEIGLELIDRHIDPLAERHPIELVEHGAVKALADSIIRHDDFGALMFGPFLREKGLW